ncbi:synapse differentiation-inducing gene protein 1-like [Elgaria multicarinata webbii]|uniref:synapse differentiation-inducing gene protein 1-like n=1 Tax=Elgaria multicarinata webbii TaxID=159646 RepID=UPI002FCCD945
MSSPNYEKVEDKMPDPQNPPPYSEKESYRGPDPSAGPLPPMGYGAPSPMPNQYQPYYGAPGADSSQGPVLQPPQAVFITPVQPTNEPDYLVYSIFTMLCCCLPLGIAALVYSIMTREANHMGNLTAAQRNSRLARVLAHSAVGVGLGCLILYIALMVILTTTTT